MDKFYLVIVLLVVLTGPSTGFHKPPIFLEENGGVCTWKRRQRIDVWNEWRNLYSLKYDCNKKDWVVYDDYDKNDDVKELSANAKNKLCESYCKCKCKKKRRGVRCTWDQDMEIFVEKKCLSKIGIASFSNTTEEPTYPSNSTDKVIIDSILNITTSSSSSEVVQNLKIIEDEVKLMAINVSNSNSTSINKLGFSLASVLSTSQTTAGVTLNVADTKIQLKSDDNNTHTSIYAARLNLPEDAMSLLIQNNTRSDDKEMKKQKTTLLPYTPYITAGGVSSNGRSTNSTSIQFTFQMRSESIEEVTHHADKGKRLAVTNLVPICSFVDTKTNLFSSVGCQLVPSRDKRNITCSCNHTTMFAVLLTTTTIEVPHGVKILSFITESISLICLVITVAILVKLRQNIDSDRTWVQINLCVALFLLHLVLLFQEFAVGNDRTCELVTVLIHYFLLASGAWMSVEGLVLLMITSHKTLELQAKKGKAILKWKYLLGWGVPAIIVAFASVIGFVTENYMDVSKAHKRFAIYPNSTLPKYNYCWLSSSSKIRIPAVVLPLVVAMAFNVIVAIKVAAFVAKMREEQKKYVPHEQQCSCFNLGPVELDQLVAATKALCMLVPALGISWVFALLAGMEDAMSSEIFMYLNALVTGLQGFMLLLVYCVFNTNVRRLMQRRMQFSTE